MRSLFSLGLVLLAACPGDAPPPLEPDAGEPPIEGQRVNGKAIDYFADMPLADVAVATDGITPQLTATSGAEGLFAFESVPIGGQIFFSASRTNYRPTRNMPVSVGESAVEADIYVLSIADINRQYATDGKTPTAGRAFVVAELQRPNGMPFDAVPLTDVTLVDAADVAVPGVIGPYVIGAIGDITPASTTTEIHGGKARVAFLDVPEGNFSIKVAYLDGQQQPQTLKASVTAVADGATLVRAGGMGGMGGGGMGGGDPLNPRFAEDIYPRLQTAANGGLGCANCHTLAGTASLAPFNVLAADVLAALKAKPGMIDLATPENSLLLTKPLYEPPPALQNHPNATFIDANDPNYQLILRWIQQGAL